MSIAPNFASVCSTTDSALSTSPVLAATYAMFPPISAAVARNESSLRDTIITFAPQRTNVAAMALPIPRDPPVTSAVFPCSEMSIRPTLVVRRKRS